jgi:hypothetical protein
MSDFIELTTANIRAGRSPGPKRLVGIAHILTIDSAARNTASVQLVRGEPFAVMETYEDLKKLLRVTHAAQSTARRTA